MISSWKKKRRKRLLHKQRKCKTFSTAAIFSTFFLFMLIPVVVSSTMLYTATVFITPLPPPYAHAFVCYRSNTGLNLLSSPKEKTWNGTAWSISESEMPNAESNILWVRAACSSIESRRYEKIVVTLSVDDYLDAYVWNGSSWEITGNIGRINSGASLYQSFDVAYEGASGRALLVYALLSSDGSRDIAYRIWNGSMWSDEAYIDDTGHSGAISYRWIELESNPAANSNEIALIAIDQTDADCNGWIWNGSAWGNFQQLENALAGGRDCKCMGVAYEQNSSEAMFVWCYNTYIESRKWNGTGWEDETPAIVISTLNVRWISLKADPASNQLMAITIDGQSDLNSVRWNGSAWDSPIEHDDDVTNTDRRCADFAWEPSGDQGLLVWSTALGSVAYETFTAPSTWSQTQTASNPSGHPWIQLRTNPKYIDGDVKILGATLNGNNDIFGFRWNGSTLAFESSSFTTDTTITGYECFDIAFQLF